MVTVIPRKITAVSVNGVRCDDNGNVALPTDSTPTNNSTNYVTSGGVKAELDALSQRIGNAENPAQIWVDIPFTIPVNSWTSGTNGYTAIVESSSILATSGVFVNYDSLDNAVTPITAEESTGEVTFTTETVPTGVISGTFRIIDSVNGIVPTERGGTGVAATSNDNLLTQLGAASTSALNTGLAGKQNTLTFDTTPTSGSTNPVTSGGVYEKIGAVGNTPLQTQITSLGNMDTAIEQGIAILATGDTHAAITSGQYVFVRNHSTLANGLYKASANIAANAALSTSNLTAVSGGGLNALNSQITNLDSAPSNLTAASGMTVRHAVKSRIGHIVAYNLVVTTPALSNGDVVLTGFEGRTASFNGIPTIVATDNAGNIAHFLLTDANSLCSVGSVIAGNWRMAFSFIAK